MSRLPFSFRRVGLIARNTAREGTRQKLFNFMALFALLLVLSAQWLRELNFGTSELKFIADFGFGAMAFFGSALAILTTAQLFFSEFEHRTVRTLLAKPVWRLEFVLGKYVGGVFLCATFCGLVTVLIMAVLYSRETTLMHAQPDAFGAGRAVDYGVLLAAGCGQWLKLALLSALTLLVASFARTQLFTTASGFMILVVCHLQFLVENAAKQAGSGISQVVTQVISLAFPNFQLFDFTEFLGNGSGPVWIHLGRVTVYAAGYVFAVCLLAGFIFRRREI